MFTFATDALFSDPSLSFPADYRTDATGVTQPVRLVRASEGTADFRFGDTALRSPAHRYRVRRSEIAEPLDGDRITIGAAVYVVRGAPALSANGLVWTVDCGTLDGVAS